MTGNDYNNAVKAHSNNLFRYLVKLIKDKDAASDLVQDAYLKLWQNKENVAFEKAKSWLFTTGHNAMLNRIKKDKRTESMEFGNFSEPYAVNNSFELKELIDKSLDQLPELQKSIILLRDLEGYNYKEIGDVLNLSESQVKVYLFRGRQKIKEVLKNFHCYHENN